MANYWNVRMDKMSEKLFEEAAESILKGEAQKAVDIAQKGLDDGIDPLVLMEQGFIPGINKVGDLFETGRLFLPALIYSATAMEKATEVINAAIPKEKELASGKIVLGTVEGDVHDIGKTIVVSLFKANGFDVLDLGRDVPIARFIEEAEKFGADIIGSSTLLTTTMVGQKELEADSASPPGGGSSLFQANKGTRRETDSREVIIFVTPRILSAEAPAPEMQKKVEEGFKQQELERLRQQAQ